MKANPDIDSTRVAVNGFRPLIATLTAVCERHRLRFFIVGALARDLLFEHVHGIPAPRATRDVDIAVAVSGWAQYEQLTGDLIREYGYERHPMPHRLLLKKNVLLDVIPFGDIEQPPGQVGWPPDQTFVMTTLGFQDAYRSAVVLTVDGTLPIRVASLPGLGILKLVSWSERPYDRTRDAEDFCFIMKNYYDVVDEALYTDHIDLFDAESFDRDQASARVYGRDVGSLLASSQSLQRSVLNILEAQTRDVESSPLTVAMGSGCIVDYVSRYACVQAFRTGIRDQLEDSKSRTR